VLDKNGDTVNFGNLLALCWGTIFLSNGLAYDEAQKQHK
jgi:hypothetical protein